MAKPWPQCNPETSQSLPTPTYLLAGQHSWRDMRTQGICILFSSPSAIPSARCSLRSRSPFPTRGAIFNGFAQSLSRSSLRCLRKTYGFSRITAATLRIMHAGRPSAAAGNSRPTLPLIEIVFLVGLKWIDFKAAFFLSFPEVLFTRPSAVRAWPPSGNDSQLDPPRLSAKEANETGVVLDGGRGRPNPQLST